MKRLTLFILLILTSVTVFGQLSMETLNRHAQKNLINEGYLVANEAASPLNIQGMMENEEKNVPLMGIRVGLNMTHVVSDSIVQETSSKTGFHGGMHFGIYYSRHFTMETGLLYDGRGYAKTNTNKNVVDVDTATLTTMDKYDISARFNYLQIPIYGKFTFGRDFQLYTTFGLYMGIPLTTNQEGTIIHERELRMNNGQTQDLPTMIDTLTGEATGFGGFDLGGSIGLGFRWPFKPRGFTGPSPFFFVDLKYQGSLISIGREIKEEIEINGDVETVTFPAPEAFNRGFNVSAGVVFPLSVK